VTGAPAGRIRALAGLAGPVRLVHPFPSALDAAVTLALALLAGATVGRAVLLGASMLAIQFSIGTFNDLIDAPADAIAGRSKPLVDGRVSLRPALGVGVLCGLAGLVLAGTAGLATGLIACAGYGIGLAYDVRLKASPWSWLPYAAGIPLLPVFAWVGATGNLPGPILALAGLGVLGGMSLAIANSLADAARDTTSRTRTVATALGHARAIRLGAMLDLAVGTVATTSAIALAGWVPATWVTVAGAATLAAGMAAGFGGLLQRAWEVQAIGLAILAAGWVASLAAAGLL
jgi:4-hydroxybenzoate polyprenyltransferase